MKDAELLKQYLQGGSEPAFTQLVNRYVDLAFSVALRQLRDRVLAEEAVQMTFCLLARKARHLTGYESFAGWIYRATYNISLKTLRVERTRRNREQAIATMHDPPLASASGQPREDLVPLLDEALSQLPDSDRAVLLLRFAQRKAMREVGEALGTTEAAAKMRVGRAIQKVRQFFHQRDIHCSSASLVGAMAALSADAAPTGLTASVVAAALAGSGSGAIAAGVLARAFMFMAKLKTKLALVGVGAAAVVMTGSYLLNHSLNYVPRATSDAPTGSTAEPVKSGPTQPAPAPAVGEKWVAKLRNLGLARAGARLRAALEAPPRKGTRSYPSAAVEDAVASFGPYHDQAFAIIRDVIEGDNFEARLQAIAALGRIGKGVPEARPLLWTLLKSGESRASWHALGALGNIGILPEEIGTLASMIPGQTDQLLVRYLPEEIARTIKRDPEAMKPYLSPVEALLQHEDPAVRFSGACALAELRGGHDPEILKGLAAGLIVSDAFRLRNEATGEHVRHLMAVETLQRLGPAAKPVLPELRAFAQQAPDPLMRELALRVIGTADAVAGQNDPAIHSILARDEQRDALLDRLHAGIYSREDLSQGLKEPMAVSLAASRLAELGPAAKASLPDLHQALAGKDEATRDEILAAMKQIDPDYGVARVARDPVAHGALAAHLELQIQRSQGELDEATAAPLEKLIDQFRMGNTSWYTLREVLEFAKQLEKENPRIWNAFLAKASEADPGFQQAFSPTGN